MRQAEIEKPSYEYGVSPVTAWSFYNHVTHAFKQTHPRNWMENQAKFHKFMMKGFEERESLSDEVLDQAISLDTLINKLTYEEVEKLFLGISDEDIDSKSKEEEVVEEVSSSIKRKSKKEEVIEEEEKPKSRTRTRRTKKSKVEEEVENCPSGLCFGKDYDSDALCEECSDEDFDKCEKIYNKKKNEEDDIPF